jgi:hypothetical protein
MKHWLKIALLVAACCAVWPFKPSNTVTAGEWLLEGMVHLGFKLLDGEDMLLGIG